MTRPKVDPDKRQRTAHACESCKRRKQKCNGLRPCHTCAKRNLTCTYGSPEGESEDSQPSPKRRIIDPALNGPLLSPGHNSLSPIPIQTQQSKEWAPIADSHRKPSSGPVVEVSQARDLTHSTALFPEGPKGETRPSQNPSDEDTGVVSHTSTSSDHDEEAVVYSNTRMLQDPTGRLLYIGDSATLSFLQLIRMIIDSVAGPSPFTLDPRRHRIVENAISIPQTHRRTHLLPDRQTANVLVDAYFTNISGLLEIFHRKSFMTTLDACYSDPLKVDPSWLCLLYLTFAIGLVMAAPTPGTPEDAIIQRLRTEEVDRAEVFYADAKDLGDPSAGFEDGGFWSVQALTLMAVYMLAVSKRNAAYAYYGMAVRSAFALGLHREETMCIFSHAEQSVRRNLWRSLFVLDRFLAASLGRPTAIRESDCSGTTLMTGEKPPFAQGPFPKINNASFFGRNPLGLDASVRSCHVIGVVLEKVYSKRKISTKLAQEIADQCQGGPKSLDPSLHHLQASSANPSQSIAILHVNLLYCHSLILLTRPFFLYLMHRANQDPKSPSQRLDKHGTRMERYGEACVIASSHSIALVQTALEGRYLPHRNPFVLYFLFAAALIVLSNEFCALYRNPTANESINNSLNIMNYFAQQDPQGSRLLFILTSFRDVVLREQSSRAQQVAKDEQSRSFAQAQPITTEMNDPMRNLFQGGGAFTPDIPHGSSLVDSPVNRQNSNAGTNSPHSGPPLRRASSNINDSLPTLANTSDSSHSSLDVFLDLTSVTSHPSNGSTDGSDSMGDTEIDFETLWHQWPSNNGTGVTPGPGIAMSVTPNSNLPMSSSTPPNIGAGIDVQGISGSSVPLFSMSNVEFAGS